MTTRDGVVLRADIYRPQANGRFPVLLQRNPYNKAVPGSGTWDFASPERVAAHGYVVIIQDTRGRYRSEGTFYPFRDDIFDGYDSIAWAASLPYSNGKVALYGSSYLGTTQWLATIKNPPQLVALFPMTTSWDYFDGWIYQGGALQLWFDGTWALGALGDFPEAHKWKEWTTVLPLSNIPRMLQDNVPNRIPYFRDWLEHETNDSYWTGWNIGNPGHRAPHLPAYHIAGWNDIFLHGTLAAYQQMKKQYPDTPQFLTIGPWTHYPIGKSHHVYGVIDYGDAAALDIDEELIDWSDFILKEAKGPFAKRSPVRIFVMGSNTWRDEPEWPLSRAEVKSFYLHSKGSANSAGGDGTLSLTPPASETPDRFIYDPSAPVPTTGGPLCCNNEPIPPGPQDQRAIEDRRDVLVYSTPPLSGSIEVTGPVKVVLHVGSDTPDTDFTAKLVDVYPDGRAYNLAEGILRMRRRDGLNKTASPLEVEKVYPIVIDLVATSNLFTRGHRIALEISSSNFPRFDRNLNTGEPLADGYLIRKATNTVYHDPRHPSALLLPIVAGTKLDNQVKTVSTIRLSTP